MKQKQTKFAEVSQQGKAIARKRLTQVQEAIKHRDETTLKRLNSPSMWG